jgi:ATP-dependent protease ClpP protease subunit
MSELKKDTIYLNTYSNNTVYIHDNFDDSLSLILPNIDFIINEQKDKKAGKIIFDICSNGGYAYILKELLNRVEYAKSQDIIVETIVRSQAYSCGSMLAISGTKGHRYIGEYAEHLVHLGSAGMRVQDNTEFSRMKDYIQRHFDFVKNVYKKYANIENLDTKIENDSWYIYGEDCIKQGMADKFLYENAVDNKHNDTIMSKSSCPPPPPKLPAPIIEHSI